MTVTEFAQQRLDKMAEEINQAQSEFNQVKELIASVLSDTVHDALIDVESAIETEIADMKAEIKSLQDMIDLGCDPVYSITVHQHQDANKGYYAQVFITHKSGDLTYGTLDYEIFDCLRPYLIFVRLSGDRIVHNLDVFKLMEAGQ